MRIADQVVLVSCVVALAAACSVETGSHSESSGPAGAPASSDSAAYPPPATPAQPHSPEVMVTTEPEPQATQPVPPTSSEFAGPFSLQVPTDTRSVRTPATRP